MKRSPLSGQSYCVYRLSLTTGPFVRAAMPMGVTRGQKATLRAIGWNLASDQLPVDATAATCTALQRDRADSVPIAPPVARLPA